ncbi:hypothetical protein ERX46_08945 [Brumimicrobium glaciale]|uniref:Uncharacterized protein n=1 Tax=Brumimicrobium glaciale TaxID=200475 RepID=A0A4Q4KLV6_9FLAO|nr:hypothetical protein ERX46_08945 [Brumimicrobium glaciale]
MRQKRLLLILFYIFYLVSNSHAITQESEEITNLSALEKTEQPSIHKEKELLDFIKVGNKDVFESNNAYVSFITKKAALFKGSNTIVYAEICFEIAKKLTKDNEPYQAYEYLDVVSNILKENDISEISFAAEFYEMKGTYFYDFRRYEESRILLLKALKQQKEESTLKISMINTLGLIHKKLGDIDSSIYYFNKGLKLATKIDNNEWIGIINGNLGFIYYLNGDLISARKCLILDKELSLKNEQTESALNALALLIEIELNGGRFDLVETYMKTLDSLIPQVTDYYSVMRYHYIKTIYWEHLKEYKLAYESYQQSVLYKDSSGREYDQLNLQNMIFQIKFQKNRNESELLIEKEKRTGQLYYGIAIILSVIILACIYIIYLMRKRKIYEHKILELEKEKIRTELKKNEEELNKILENLVVKNDIIDTLNQEINKREVSDENLTLQKEKEVIYEKINTFTLLTENDLLEFKHLFDKIHPSFYDSLIQKQDDLTNSETRLAMLIKLNLSSLEMSRILGISQDSVRKSNLRLRKKLSIESQKELIQFIKTV